MNLQHTMSSTPTFPTGEAQAAAMRLDLPLPAWTFLSEKHATLAKALLDAQSCEEEEANIPVEDLPEETRQYLWRAIRRHHPGLTALLQDPLFAEVRHEAKDLFQARLALPAQDLLQALRGAAA